jgi:hypothetical protein
MTEDDPRAQAAASDRARLVKLTVEAFFPTLMILSQRLPDDDGRFNHEQPIHSAIRVAPATAPRRRH